MDDREVEEAVLREAFNVVVDNKQSKAYVARQVILFIHGQI